MTSVAILAVSGERGEITYEAVAGSHRSHGRTAGEALDALTEQLRGENEGALVVVQYPRPDEFFTAEQQHRLAELMDPCPSARERGAELAPEAQAALDELIQAELLCFG